jgi:hypothetical protein
MTEDRNNGIAGRSSPGRRRLQVALVATVLVGPGIAVGTSASAATPSQVTHTVFARPSERARTQTRLPTVLKTNRVQTSAIAPSITTDDGSFVMAYVSNNGTNDILVATYNGSTWSAPVNTGQQSKATPSIIADAPPSGCEELVIAYVANNSSNDLLTTTSTNGGATWNPPTLVGGSSSPQASKMAPSITSTGSGGDDNALVMAYVANNSSNDLLVTQGNPNTGCTEERWAASTRVSTQTSKTAPAISFDNDDEDLVIAYVANNSSNDLVVTTSVNGEGTDWSQDELVGSPAQSSKTAPTLAECIECDESESVVQNVLAYVANNSSNDLIVTTSANNADDWSAPGLVGNSESSQAGPALPSQNGFGGGLPMVYVANNSKDHLLLTTSEDGGTAWSRSSKIKDGPRAH